MLKVCYVNVLWIVFTLLGLVLGGFFPATIAMFAICQKWLIGDRDIPIFTTFWGVYKKEFARSNLLGLFLLFIGVVLYVDLLMIEQTNIALLSYLYIPLFLICGLYFITLLSFFPMYVQYDVRGFQLMKNALFISFITPFSLVKYIIGLAFISYLLLTFPGSILLFGGCLPALYIMWVAKSTFAQYERKKEAIQQ